MKRSLPKARVYPIMGMILAFGAPVGFLLLQAVAVGVIPDAGWLTGELRENASFYAYMAISTTVVLGILGWLLGRQSDRLEATSLTDPLTGLGNRRVLDLQLEQEVLRSARYGQPLAFLLIDVDHLKTINDRDGHQAGDTALLAVADALRRGCRATDVAGRFGGDEFAVLAPSTSERGAKDLAERIRSALRGPTVSIGIGELAAGMSGPELRRVADRALYRAKVGGRDQVAVAEAEPAAAHPSAWGSISS